VGEPLGLFSKGTVVERRTCSAPPAADSAAARATLERFYRWCDAIQVAELSRLARTVDAWRPRSWPGTDR